MISATKLLEVIEHDVRRLDRLVSDISNASRLDSELVKEEQEAFDLLTMLRNLGQYLGEEAANQKGIDFITDFPEKPIVLLGLEARLAQVFVNLITNAMSASAKMATPSAFGRVNVKTACWSWSKTLAPASRTWR